MNRSGKSELLRYLWAGMSCRRVLVDPKGEWQVTGAPMHQLQAVDPGQAAAEIAGIDWSAPVIHVRPAWHGAGDRAARAQLAALYAAIARLPGPACVWTDEGYGASSASWSPFSDLQVAGAGRGHGHFAATQRPRNVATELFTEADHLFLVPPLTRDDFDHAVRNGAAFLEAGEAWDLAADLPEHGYLWIDRRDQVVRVGPPLPAHLLELGRDLVTKRPAFAGAA